MGITSDITEFTCRAGKLYLCIHKDVAGQMVYGFDVSLNATAEMTVKSFKKAIKTISRILLKNKINNQNRTKNKMKIIYHQDRGSQYTSYMYINTVLKNQGILSYSDPGNPTQNAGQESFFGRFKDEYKDEIAELETFEEVIKFIKQKIYYFNYERRHTSIGLISPYQYIKQFLQNQVLLV